MGMGLRHLLRLSIIFIFLLAIVGFSILSIQIANASTNFENHIATLFETASANLNQTEHAKEQSDLKRLLQLCNKGDSQGDPYTITKWSHISGRESQIYLNTCYPLEISATQTGRSMGHCSDFILFVYYSGARLNPEFSDTEYTEKMLKCPNSTFLHGEYPIWTQFDNGARNLWMPNIEQVKVEQEKFIPKTTKLLAKTLKTFTILKEYLEDKQLDIPLLMTSHSTPDPLYQLETSVKRNFGTFYHGNGHSGLKSTTELIKCWKDNQDFPLLTIVGNHEVTEAPNIRYYHSLNISELRRLQWENGIHICASIREGFGHYINEARAMEAMLISTDFGPMNEFLDKNSGVLVKNDGLFHEDYQLFLNVQVKISDTKICEAVKTVLNTEYSTREQMGKVGRLQYLVDYKKMKISKSELKIDTVEHFTNKSISLNQANDFLWNLEQKMQAYAKGININIDLN